MIKKKRKCTTPIHMYQQVLAVFPAKTKLRMPTYFTTYRVRAVHDEPLEQDAGDLLLDHLRLGLREQVEQHAAEVVRVLVGVPELVGHGVEEEVPPLRVELVGQLRSPFSVSSVSSVSWRRRFPFHGGGTDGIERRGRARAIEIRKKKQTERKTPGYGSEETREISAVRLGANNAELETVKVQ